MTTDDHIERFNRHFNKYSSSSPNLFDLFERTSYGYTLSFYAAEGQFKAKVMAVLDDGTTLGRILPVTQHEIDHGKNIVLLKIQEICEAMERELTHRDCKACGKSLDQAMMDYHTVGRGSAKYHHEQSGHVIPK